jgi:hypothetical protein|tara:strand:+ start:2410 stop:4731 length:2322 start_codon:yes stop_codon:yes gene_type:complete
MSLYDDATFIYSGEAAAGAPHRAYTLKPAEKLKPTVLNANSDLSSSGTVDGSSNSLGLVLADSSTNSSASIANGLLTITTGADGASTKARVYTSNGTSTAYLESGKSYNLTYTVVENNGVTDFKYAEDGIIRPAPTEIGTHAVSFKRGEHNNSPYFYLQSETPSSNIVLKDIIVREAEQRSLDFRVTRGSNLAATRVKADGLIEKGRENLIRYSNTLTGAGWSNTTGTPTNYNAAVGGKSGYDGSMNAWLLEKTTLANSYVGMPFFGYNGVYTWSMYAKNEGTRTNGLHMYTEFATAYFDLVNGTIDAQGGSNKIAAEMVPVTGQAGDTDRWYRCSVTGSGEIVDGDSEDRPRFKIVNIDGSDEGGGFGYSADGKIFIQNVQFERGVVATPYIDSKNMTGKAGLLVNEPRYDYLTSTTDCPGALMEPGRTNLFVHSEYFAGTFNPIRTTFEEKNAKSPEGFENAVFIKETSATNDTHGFQFIDFDIDDGEFYSLSFFVKAKGREKFFCQFSEDTVLKMNVTVDLSGTPSAVDNKPGHTGSEEIINYGDGWYRVEINGKEGLANDDTRNINFFFIEDASGTNTTYDGDTTKGLLFYGLQIEKGPFCTSYIPTYGSTVTRTKDVFVSPVDDSEYATDDFTFFIDYKDFKSNGLTSAGLWRALYRDSIASSHRSIFQYNTSIGYHGFPSSTPSTSGSEYSSNHAPEGANKIAVVYNRDSVAVYVDGSQTKLDYSVDTTKNGLQFIDLNYGSSKMTLNSIMVFNRPLTKDEAIALTT